MRFKKTPTFEFTDTPRKRAALRRKQRRERDALPLFAEQIAAEQPSGDEEMSRRAELSDAQEIRWRSDRAAEWRKARRMIDSLPAEERLAIRRVWDCAPYPADPSRLLSVLHSCSLGKIDLRRPPFPLSKTDAGGATIATPDPAGRTTCGLSPPASSCIKEQRPQPGHGRPRVGVRPVLAAW